MVSYKCVMQLIFSAHHMLLWSVCVCHHWSHSGSMWFRNAVWVCLSGIARLGVGCMWLGSLVPWFSHVERTELGTHCLHMWKITYILVWWFIIAGRAWASSTCTDLLSNEVTLVWGSLRLAPTTCYTEIICLLESNTSEICSAKAIWSQNDITLTVIILLKMIPKFNMERLSHSCAVAFSWNE